MLFFEDRLPNYSASSGYHDEDEMEKVPVELSKVEGKLFLIVGDSHNEGAYRLRLTVEQARDLRNGLDGMT
jgi:hypothetical protein